jgi:hypothetical protein
MIAMLRYPVRRAKPYFGVSFGHLRRADDAGMWHVHRRKARHGGVGEFAIFPWRTCCLRPALKRRPLQALRKMAEIIEII